jgi:hypothetical protein
LNAGHFFLNGFLDFIKTGGFLELTGKVGGHALEIAHGFANLSRDFGQFPWSKDHQADDRDDRELHWTHSEKVHGLSPLIIDRAARRVAWQNQRKV